MGALHAGHASLVMRSVEENDVTVVSVFVNPTQFNDPKDLEKYPRTLEADCSLLKSLKVDVVFAPTPSEIYPTPDMRTFSYSPTDQVMEGAYRPGHFNGVCQIVSKLFMFVEPDRAYFGEKDFQQIAVIKAMVSEHFNPNIDLARNPTLCWGEAVEIVSCPIVREEDGLALSSRNMLLKPHERDIAPYIFHALNASLEYAKTHDVKETREWVISKLNSVNGLRVQYYDIVDARTLVSVNSWDDAQHIQGCITVFCGNTPIRLIDNINYK